MNYNYKEICTFQAVPQFPDAYEELHSLFYTFSSFTYLRHVNKRRKLSYCWINTVCFMYLYMFLFD